MISSNTIWGTWKTQKSKKSISQKRAIYFCVILPMNTFMDRTVKKGQKPTHKKCPECLSEVPIELKDARIVLK